MQLTISVMLMAELSHYWKCNYWLISHPSTKQRASMDHQSLILFHLLCCVITVFCKAVVKCCHAHPMVFIAEHSAAGQETGLQVSICWLGFMGRSLPLGLPNAESLHRLMLQHTHPNDLSDKSVSKSKCRLFATFSVSERQKMRAVNAKWILMEATTPAGMVRAHSKHRNIHGSHEGNEGCRVAWLHEVQVQYNKAIEDLDACFLLNISILLSCTSSWRNYSYWVIWANC